MEVIKLTILHQQALFLSWKSINWQFCISRLCLMLSWLKSRWLCWDATSICKVCLDKRHNYNKICNFILWLLQINYGPSNLNGIKWNRMEAICPINKTIEPEIVNIILSIKFYICFGCSIEPSHWDVAFEYQQHMFWFRNKKNIFWLC